MLNKCYLSREFLERQSKKMLDKTNEKIMKKLEDVNQSAKSKIVTKEKELSGVADEKMKQLTENPPKDSSSINNLSKVLALILGLVFI